MSSGDIMHATSVAMAGDSAISIRLALPDDLPFIQDSWLRSYIHIMPAYANTYGQTRAQWVAKVRDVCLQRTPVVVAHMPEVAEVVLGWGCGSKDGLHYVYVKNAARRHGVCRRVLSALGVSRGTRMTHRPAKHMRAFADKLGLQYRPLSAKELT